MKETSAPIPYAHVTEDGAPAEVLARPLPATLDELRRYAAGDVAFVPPHWVRMRAARDPAVGARLLDAWRTLTPQVEAFAGSTSDKREFAEAFSELELDSGDALVQAFAADALERSIAPGAEPALFAMAAQGRGERFDLLFSRADVPSAAHLLRLAALRDHGGMPWSDTFQTAMTKALPGLGREAAGWTLRFIAELPDPRARRFLQWLASTTSDPRARDDIGHALVSPPGRGDGVEPAEGEEALPTAMDKLELGALDPRKPQRRIAYLGRMADLDWSRTRRLASSITTEDWRLDELIGGLLNHPTHEAMAEDFLKRGLLPRPTTPPAGKPSARELLRSAGRVVRFDTTSTDGVIDHDALAYMLARAMGDALEGVDFLEEVLPDRSLVLHAWDGGKHFTVDLDTRRSVVDPYGLVGLVNVISRARDRAERGMLAAEDKAMCDVVIGPEKVLRELVDAGLLWIRAGFRW